MNGGSRVGCSEVQVWKERTVGPKVLRAKSARAERIEAILADTRSEADALSAWRTHLKRALRFPFVAKLEGHSGVKPLAGGAFVQVIGLASEAPGDARILAKVMDGQKSISIPLEQLALREDDAEQAQPMSDWRYWRSSFAAR